MSDRLNRSTELPALLSAFMAPVATLHGWCPALLGTGGALAVRAVVVKALGR